MTPERYFRAQAHNNAWANHRLLSACATLPQRELNARRSGFFPSIMSTLNHILLVDEFYVSAFEGDCCGPGIFDEGNAHQVLEPLAAAQRAVDTRLISVCVSPVSREIELIRGWGVQNERLDRGLMHLFQHQIHHRGQVHSMLSDAGIEPPQLDEFFLSAGHERGLRTEDFAALGFSESDIWNE